MTLDHRVANLIGLAYETIVSDEAWDTVCCELLRLTSGRFMFLSNVDVIDREYSFARFVGAGETRIQVGSDEYLDQQHLVDPSLAYAGRHPNARYCDTRTIASPDDEYMQWHRARLGSPYWIVGYTPPVNGLTFGVSLHPARDADLSPGSEALFRLVFEHMARAAELGARRDSRQVDDQHAIIMLDARGRVVSRSPAADAILSQHDGLSVDLDGSLRCWAAKDDDALKRNIACALDVLDRGNLGGASWINRPTGRRRYLGKVRGLPVRASPAAMFRPTVSVEVVDLVLKGGGHPEWSAIFGLTQRECELAELLLLGHSIETLSETLGISRHTARVHLAALFRKTDTNRQAELIRLLLKVAG